MTKTKQNNNFKAPLPDKLQEMFWIYGVNITLFVLHRETDLFFF